MLGAAYTTETQALEVLLDTSAGELKREEAIRFLGRHPSQQSIRALIDSLEDDDFGVRWEAAVTLAEYGELSVLPLLGVLMDPQRVSCPRLREGANLVFENNASPMIITLSMDLRKALKGPAADIATMGAAYRLQQRLKRMQWTPRWGIGGNMDNRMQKSGLQDDDGVNRKNTNLVKFYAKDPYYSKTTDAQLEWYIERIHDVWDWRLQPDGQVLVQYDPSKISDEIIEEALAQNGFVVKHIADVPGGYIQ